MLLNVRDLCVAYPSDAGIVRAVDGVNLHIEASEILCLVGESGCGKSSTAAALIRLLPHGAQVSGSIRFAGQFLNELSDDDMRSVRGLRIGFVFQDAASSLNPIYAVGNQIVELLRCHFRHSRRTAWIEAIKLFHEMSIGSPERVARQYPHELSGGTLQRVALAMALAPKPRLLIADEPTAALDVRLQRDILRTIKELRQRTNIGLLWITHDFDVVSAIADRVAVMYAGQIVESGPVRDVFATPLHPYTKGLLQCRPRLGDRGPLPIIPGLAPSPMAWPNGCRFRERCGHATERCLEMPQAEVKSPGRICACWNWQNLGKIV